MPREILRGGKGDGRKPSDFNPHELRMGIKVEMEHTRDRRIAREIAMDHLSEDPRYYSKLKRIHREHTEEPAMSLENLFDAICQINTRLNEGAVPPPPPAAAFRKKPPVQSRSTGETPAEIDRQRNAHQRAWRDQETVRNSTQMGTHKDKQGQTKAVLDTSQAKDHNTKGLGITRSFAGNNDLVKRWVDNRAAKGESVNALLYAMSQVLSEGGGSRGSKKSRQDQFLTKHSDLGAREEPAFDRQMARALARAKQAPDKLAGYEKFAGLAKRLRDRGTYPPGGKMPVGAMSYRRK